MTSSCAPDEVQKTSKVRLSFDAEDCSIAGVTVFRSCAEVVRVISFPVSHRGEITIDIKCLTMRANPDSIRFNGNESCKIIEVGHEVSTDTIADSENQSQARTLKAKLSELQKAHAEKKTIETQLSKRKQLVQSYADGVLSNAKLIDLSQAKEILEFHTTEISSIDGSIAKIAEEKESINLEISMIEGQLGRLGVPSNRTVITRVVTVLIDVSECCAASGTVQFSYVVDGACWTASYDMRVRSADNSMSVDYFAEVEQSTGEHWENCDLFLSTSNPAVGSNPAPIPTKIVDWDYAIARFRPSAAKKSSTVDFYDGHRHSFSLMDDADGSDAGGGGVSFLKSARGAIAPPPAGKIAHAAEVLGSGDAGCTMFTIARKVSIAGDSKPHKVLVASLQFTSQMIHYVAPSVSTSVYMQSKTLNLSPYPLLASEKVSVFLDGNFISTSSLKQVR
jgi:hypothetical protein